MSGDAAQWAGEHFARIVEQAPEHGVGPRELVTAFAGMAGNIIALNFPEAEREELLCHLETMARSAIDYEIRSKH